MNDHINARLVETVARRYLDAQLEKLNTAANKADIPADAFRTWDELDGISKFNKAEYALHDLNLIIPVLIEHGWMPPSVNDAIREAVRDQSVNELHKSLMGHLEPGYYDTPEGLNGYSEGVEHGTISLTSRIKTILDGEQS